MTVQDQFNKFLENISLTDLQKEDAEIKYKWVAKTLHKFYYPNKEYDGSTKFLFGSYRKNTNVRPPRDIDLLFKIPEEVYNKYKEQDNWPSNLLQEIRDIWKDKYSTTDKISAWWKVVLFKFSDWTHNVEVLPAYEDENKIFTIPNTVDWWSREEFDPRSNIKSINDCSDSYNGTKCLIKMLKKWVEKTKTFKMSSFELENFILSFLDSNNINGKSYCEIINIFFSFMLDEIDDLRKSHLETAYERSSKAFNYDNEWKAEKSCRELKKIFWNVFPLPEDSKESINKILAFPSKNEEYIEDYVENIDINSLYKFKIDCKIEQDWFRVKLLSEFLRCRHPLYSKKKLTFYVASNTIPYPYTLYWKVRNFGDQAKNHNDLRGEITLDWGKEMKKENTKYFGEHYVTCYCIKDDVCVAMDTIMVPVTI